MPYELLDAAPPTTGRYELLDPLPAAPTSMTDKLINFASGANDFNKNAGKGFASGVADLGDALLNGASRLADKVGLGVSDPSQSTLGRLGIAPPLQGRSESLKAFNDENQDSLAFRGARLAGNVAATWPVGGVLGAGMKAAAPFLGPAGAAMEALGTATATGGMSTGMKVAGAAANTAAGVAAPSASLASRIVAAAPDMATRMAGGAINGAATTAASNSDDIGTGALIGGAFPVAGKILGAAGSAIGAAADAAGRSVRSGLTAGGATPEVAALANRAQELGINIPADRIVNSRPLNAMASGLNYVPFSGRAAVESGMNSQMNQALSRTFGQDSSNVTGALRKADSDLGGKFDSVLQNNNVAVDKTFFEGVTNVVNKAERELGSADLKPIASYADEIFEKGASGQIDGQAAYNIKRNLDRIGRGNTPAAYHALELKGELMGALNRSLGPDEAAAFAQTRQQYGNMLSLQKLAKNGVDGELSAARIANMPNINNQPLQEIADIAAQFIKPREGWHGAAQRAGVGAAAAFIGGVPGVMAGVGLGRATNMTLNSNLLRNAVLRQPGAQGGVFRQGAQGGGLLSNAIDNSAPLMYRSNGLLANKVNGLLSNEASGQ